MVKNIEITLKSEQNTSRLNDLQIQSSSGLIERNMSL